jgi:hypothetical protein
MKSGLRTYRVTLTGTMPLLMHSDDIDWADKMEAWKNDKDNKKTSRAGDDRSPAHRWMGSLYHNEAGDIIIPTENIMRSMMEGAAGIPVPGGKSGKTFKSQSQSGIIPRDVGWPLYMGAPSNGISPNGSKAYSYGPLKPLLEEKNFQVHKEVCESCGFTLYVKRARIGQSKHIRVRPRFENWAASGELIVIDEQITTEVLSDILEYAGKYKGLGDWRPSSKTPGTFGTFLARIEAI